eukprot:353987-Hanusia_phi.AAC.1
MLLTCELLSYPASWKQARPAMCLRGRTGNEVMEGGKWGERGEGNRRKGEEGKEDSRRARGRGRRRMSDGKVGGHKRINLRSLEEAEKLIANVLGLLQ